MEIFQWFNPFAWMLSKDLQNIHEFEADSIVIRQGEDAHNYQLLLIEKAISMTSFSLANSFNSSQIKQRIHMMNKRPSSSWAKMKHIYLMPIAFFLMVTFSSQASSIPQESTELTDEMKETLIYIARHLKYPTDAFEKGVQGKVVLELHLTEHEHLNTVKVIESVAPSLDAEAVRIIKESPVWKTSHKGISKQVISVNFTLK
jgi:TonB family protein